MKRAFVLGAILLVAGACKRSTPANVDIDAPVPKADFGLHHDLPGLQKHFNVPGSPKSVIWCQGGFADPRPAGAPMAGGSDGYKVVALLTYDTSARAEVSRAWSSAKTVAGEPPVLCFPETETKAALKAITGDVLELGPAAKPPLTHGYVVWTPANGTLLLYAHSL